VAAAHRIVIEHQCPQCGAPATLEETDRLFTCTYCRVKSFLANRDSFRYLLPHPETERPITYLPYWRIKGILFSSLHSGIEHKIVDVSSQAFSSPHFPVSLGLRSQTMKLRFLLPGSGGRFLKATVPMKKMKAAVQQSFSTSLGSTIFKQALIGETVSIIYSPFYIGSRVHDAVLNRPVSDPLPEAFEVESAIDPHPEQLIRFIPALCPKCGWDLDGERDSLVLHCKNCRILYQAEGEKFQPIRVAHLPPAGEDGLFLPFYQVEAKISGIRLDSFADLVLNANLPKVVQKEWENWPFRFWSPAFKIRPEDFLRFARNLTLSQPRSELLPGVPKASLHPVTLSVREASEGLKIHLASFLKPAEVMLPRLREIRVKPQKALLVYIPFQEERTDLSNQNFQLRVNKNLLRFAKNL
jgi:DNA-directed RNA polymerase subunit RPC12/RpoP